MLGHESAILLKTSLETISELEMLVESHRQDLCRAPGFAPYTVFCRLDRNAQERLDAQAIHKFISSRGASSNVGDCGRLIKFFDSDEDGFLSYADFIQIVLPCDDNVLRDLV